VRPDERARSLPRGLRRRCEGRRDRSPSDEGPRRRGRDPRPQSLPTRCPPVVPQSGPGSNYRPDGARNRAPASSSRMRILPATGGPSTVRTRVNAPDPPLSRVPVCGFNSRRWHQPSSLLDGTVELDMRPRPRTSVAFD
jgi:hypothetical protein